jgi:DNA-binding MarR family transcriptional regulator
MEVTMPKLTDTHLVILSAAAQRADAMALPLPKSLNINRGAATSALKGLIKRGLLAERPATKDDEAWRETEDGQRIALAVTSAGLEAIGVEPEEVPSAVARVAEPKRPAKKTKQARKGAASCRRATTIRLGTKQALLIDMLEREGGATITEIVEATGWQPHSIRGAISGAVKKKLGLVVETEVIDNRGRVYRITGTA